MTYSNSVLYNKLIKLNAYQRADQEVEYFKTINLGSR